VQEETLILAEPRDWLPLMLPGTERVHIKVYKMDEVNHRAVVKVRLDPHTLMPRQIRHCYALAYTISGSWTCDDESFEPGDAAYEMPGGNRTPRSKVATEIVIVLDSPTGQYIDNLMPDGSVLHLGEPWLKALEGIGLEEYLQLDQQPLIDVLPAKRKVT
jgi:hypothetical protein